MRHDQQFIGHDNVRLHYRIAGSGPAVLLLHGWALDADMWSPQFDALAGRYCLIALDRRGFGRSTGDPSISGDLRDIEYLLRTLELERAAIIGMSQGARSAVRWALRHPGTVSCLVLDGPPQEDGVEDDSGEEPPMAAYRKLARSSGIDAVRQAWTQHPLMQLRSSDVQTSILLREMIARYPGRDLSDAPSERPPLPEYLQSGCPPTLVINGEHDSSQRLACGAAMVHRLPNSRHVLIPNSGHLPNLDNPQAYNEVIEAFLHPHALGK